jgi:hypothetical protein
MPGIDWALEQGDYRIAAIGLAGISESHFAEAQLEAAWIQSITR